MKREILFRGKRAGNGEWIEGYLIAPNYIRVYRNHESNNNLLVFDDFKIIPETVGQYTGLKDKNGKEIYGGDILLGQDMMTHLVKWDNYLCGFNIVEYGIYQQEIVGNIYENPELLKEEE